MKYKKITTKKAIYTITLFAIAMVIISIFTIPTAHAFLRSPDGGTIAFSIPCVSSLGPGSWTIKTNSNTPIIYLYPSRTMRKNYLPPVTGITTLGFVGIFIDCTTTTIPPLTLTGRISTMYGTAIGF